MSTIRKIVKDMVDTIPDEKLKKVFEVLEGFVEQDIGEAWSIWEEFGKDAAEGKWKDASEKHNFYLYGIKR
ncbi:MAG: hypothetical protein HYW14_00570 [Planctomycetes bacterium]|nr:hypothetical protein [Planctomycetota bacterium]